MEEARKIGRMVVGMLVSGRRTGSRATESCFTLMERSTKANGSRTKLPGSEFTHTATVLATLVAGMKTTSTASAQKPGLMGPLMKASTNTVRKTGRENSSSAMDHSTKDFFKMMS